MYCLHVAIYILNFISDTSKRTIPRSFVRPGRSGPVEDSSPEEDKDNQSVEQQHNGKVQCDYD